MGSWVDIINERPPVMEEEDKQSLVESEMGLETSSEDLEVASCYAADRSQGGPAVLV